MISVDQLLRDLIALPSVNPAFLPPDHPSGGEKQVGDYLAAQAAKAGLSVEFQTVLPNRDNLIARLTPPGKVTRRILLAPHLDTAALASESQLQPREDKGRIFGRGACDTKGSIATFLTALLELANSKQRPKSTEIVFAGLVDEESSQGGSRVLAASGFQADLAIVGEPTQCRAVTAHKGDLWLRLQTKGRAAHGSQPHLGRNAILDMARVVQALEEEYSKSLRGKKHPLIGSASINVGTIQGGKQPNIVPDQCEISIDRRTLPGETQKGIVREIRQLLEKRKLRAGILDIKELDSPPLETSPDLPLVRQFMKCCRQSRPIGVDFFCDAAILSAAGTPSVVFGPGNIAQAHTADEWVAIKQLNQAVGILKNFLGNQP